MGNKNHKLQYILDDTHLHYYGVVTDLFLYGNTLHILCNPKPLYYRISDEYYDGLFLSKTHPQFKYYCKKIKCGQPYHIIYKKHQYLNLSAEIVNIYK